MAIMKSFFGEEVYDAVARGYLTPVMTSGSGAAYVATVEGLTTLVPGVSCMIVPHATSTALKPTLNVNNLGAKEIKQRYTGVTSEVADGRLGWMSQDTPVRLVYDGKYWVADSYGIAQIYGGGTGATEAHKALNNLGITWGTAEAPAKGTPNSIYIQIN